MASRSYAPWRPLTMVVTATLLAVVAGCGGSATAAREPAGGATETDRWLERAEEHERARRYDLARTAYQRAKDAAPDASVRARAARQFARALLFWGEYADGATELAEVVRLAPEDAGAWHDLGIVRHELGEPAAAEEALRRAGALAPRDPRPRIALAALLLNQQRYDEALVIYRDLRELELPPRLREQVDWAVAELERRTRGP